MKERKDTLWRSLGLCLLLSLGACECGSIPVGKLTVALDTDAPTHDVASVHIRIIAAGGDCATDETLTEATMALDDMFLPENLDVDGDSGSRHPFGDALFILGPDDWKVCATPLDAAGDPSAECAEVEADATVLPEATTEVILVSQCVGAPEGGLDVAILLNDPPLIEDVKVLPSKFLGLCEQADIDITATDANADDITYTWSVAQSPLGSTPLLIDTDETATFSTDTTGDYEINVIVSDEHNASSEMTFPVHVDYCPGQLMSSTTYDSGDTDSAEQVATDSSGAVIGVGTSAVAGTDRIRVTKWDPITQLVVWSRFLPAGTGGSYGRGVAIDGNDDVFVLGYATNGPLVWWLVKLDGTNGATLNDQQLATGLVTAAVPSGIAIDGWGDLVVCGYSSAANTAAVAAKFDGSSPFGLQWLDSSTYGRTNATFEDVAVDNTGNVYCVGGESDAGDTDALIAKFDAVGNLLWDDDYDNAGASDLANGVAVDTDGAPYLAGYSGGDTLFRIYAPGGSVIATDIQDLGGGAADQGRDIVLDALDSAYIGGVAGTDFVISKFTSSGTFAWSATHDVETDVGVSVDLDANGDVVLFGTLQTAGDWWLGWIAP